MNFHNHKSMIPELLDYYDQHVTQMIVEKYQYEHLEAFRQFVTSETHKMLEDKDCELWEFGPAALFEMWEVEKITGDPRNSIYIRED